MRTLRLPVSRARYEAVTEERYRLLAEAAGCRQRELDAEAKHRELGRDFLAARDREDANARVIEALHDKVTHMEAHIAAVDRHEVRRVDTVLALQADNTRLLELLAREQARTDTMFDRVAKLAELMATPAPIVTNQHQQRDFTDFPPIVAAALSQVCAGLPKDIQREQYARAHAMLAADKKPPDEVARLIRQGQSVSLVSAEDLD